METKQTKTSLKRLTIVLSPAPLDPNQTLTPKPIWAGSDKKILFGLTNLIYLLSLYLNILRLKALIEYFGKLIGKYLFRSARYDLQYGREGMEGTEKHVSRPSRFSTLSHLPNLNPQSPSIPEKSHILFDNQICYKSLALSPGRRSIFNFIFLKLVLEETRSLKKNHYFGLFLLPICSHACLEQHPTETKVLR